MTKVCATLILAMTGLLFGFTDPADTNYDGNVQAVIQQHTQVWSKGEVDLIPRIYARDYVGHFPGGEVVRGREGIRSLVESHRKSFPDWREVVVETISEGDRVASRYRSTGTHRGEFLGISPTGNVVEVAEVSVYRMVDGQIAEQWAFPDVVSLQQQLSAGKNE